MSKNFVFRGKVNNTGYTFANRFLGGDIENNMTRYTTQRYQDLNYINFNNDRTAIYDQSYIGDPIDMDDPLVTKSFSKIIVNKSGSLLTIVFSPTSQSTITFTDNKYNSILQPASGSPVPQIVLESDTAIELTWTGEKWVLK